MEYIASIYERIGLTGLVVIFIIFIITKSKFRIEYPRKKG